MSPSEAYDLTRAVLDVLMDAVTAGELQDLLAELPEEFQTLLKPPAARKWADSHMPPVRTA